MVHTDITCLQNWLLQTGNVFYCPTPVLKGMQQANVFFVGLYSFADHSLHTPIICDTRIQTLSFAYVEQINLLSKKRALETYPDYIDLSNLREDMDLDEICALNYSSGYALELKYKAQILQEKALAMQESISFQTIDATLVKLQICLHIKELTRRNIHSFVTQFTSGHFKVDPMPVCLTEAQVDRVKWREISYYRALELR